MRVLMDTPGSGASDGFAGFCVLARLVGVAITVYKVVMARDQARKSGMDPDQATAMTLTSRTTASRRRTSPPTCVSRAQQAAPRSEGAAGDRTVTERLGELEALREQGLVTQGRVRRATSGDPRSRP